MNIRSIRSFAAILLFLLIAPPVVLYTHAQSPFRFREAYLLERRMSPDRSGFMDISHFDENMGRVTPTFPQTGDCMIRGCKDPDGKHVSDLHNLYAYQNGMWLGLLEQADKSRDEGAFAVAGPVYEVMIANLRKAKGKDSREVALMLDHLGEYYLEARNFARAYETIEQAVAVRRVMLQALPPEPREGLAGSDLQKWFEISMHLADMQTRLGQMDLGRGNLSRAQERLNESVTICNRKDTVRFVGSLFAVYFASLLEERQGKWKDAEELWQRTVALREPLDLCNTYWDSLREMAAFYARWGDFHTAARIADKVEVGIRGKQLRPSTRMPYAIDSRPRREVENGGYGIYLRESWTALQEIRAVNKWQTDGPAAGATLLPSPYVATREPLFDFGADAESAKLLSWIEQRVFLHMSILLDGRPAQQQVDTAYQLLCNTKGRYLASIAAVTKDAENGRNKPGIDTDALPIMDEMEEAREYQAKLYLQTALDGKPFPEAEFGAVDNVQRILSKSLSAGTSIGSLTPDVSLEALVEEVPPDVAFLDFVLWNRMDRDTTKSPHREYGVFVVRHGHAVHYVRLEAAEAVDKGVDDLKSGMHGCHTRTTFAGDCEVVNEQTHRERLKSLYISILEPLEEDLRGTNQLLIVPDGKITVAPISALIDRNGHSVLEKYTVSYLNSWREVASSIHFDSEAPGQPVVVANPDFDLIIGDPAPVVVPSLRPTFTRLPGAELEAGDIGKALNLPEDHILIGKAGRKWLIQSLTSPRILHFATHTVSSLGYTPPIAEYDVFDIPQAQTSTNPLLQSFITLAGANHEQGSLEDGILTGLEVSRLHLTGTSLVVLSTCESGQGTVVQGLGLIGLRAAFSMAGAHALVMTLWPVDDAAGRQFMKFFYAHLAQGAASALRQAQLEMISKTPYTNPFYWSGYVASGAPEIEAKTPQHVANTALPTGKETFITPRCFELSMTSQQGPYTHHSNVRVKIGGIVYRKQDSSEQATYDLSGPGNSIIERSRLSSPGYSSIVHTTGEGRTHWTGTITVQNHKEFSSVSLRFGRPSTDESKRDVITLQGGPKLFLTLDIPESLPDAPAYNKNPNLNLPGLMLDRVGACTTTPSW